MLNAPRIERILGPNGCRIVGHVSQVQNGAILVDQMRPVHAVVCDTVDCFTDDKSMNLCGFFLQTDSPIVPILSMESRPDMNDLAEAEGNTVSFVTGRSDLTATDL